jgi:hypothetical protein
LQGATGQNGVIGASGATGPTGATGLTGATGAGSTVSVLDEGVTITSNVTSLNFVGSGVTASNTANAVTVTISSGGTPGGSNTQVQFNDSGSFAGNANFTFDKTSSNLTVNGNVIANSFVSNASGTPTLSSNTDIRLTATGTVIVTQTPFRVASYTTTQRNGLTATNGDLIYNSTTNKFQGYAGGTWVDLH